MAAAGGYHFGGGPGGDDGEQAVIHRGQFLWSPTVICPIVGFPRCAVRLVAAFFKAAQRVVSAVEQDDFVEAGAGLVGQVLQLLQELHPAQELGDHDIVPRGQVDAGGGQSNRAGEQSGCVWIIAPLSH